VCERKRERERERERECVRERERERFMFCPNHFFINHIIGNKRRVFVTRLNAIYSQIIFNNVCFMFYKLTRFCTLNIKCSILNIFLNKNR
jgi:hypothetical protein